MSAGVLVLRALGIGDLLTGVPALRALHGAFPGERLVLAAPEGLRDLVELIDAVDELLPTAGLGALDWPGAPPELAVNLHGRGPESIHDLLATRPDALLTHRHPDFGEVAGLDWRDDLHEVDRWCRLVEYARLDADRAALRLPAPPGPNPAPGAVVLHPGAAFPARRWPPDRFATVARELQNLEAAPKMTTERAPAGGDAIGAAGCPTSENERTCDGRTLAARSRERAKSQQARARELAEAGCRVVIAGGAGERTLAAGIAASAGLPEDAVLAGKTGLGELAALVAGAALVVCGDTGVGHLATAFGTPSVLLFGPTPPRRWGPPPSATQHVVLWAGNVGDPHADRPDDGLLLLGEGRVLAAAKKLLRERVSHG